MEPSKLVLWLAEIIVAWFLLFAIQIPLRRSKLKVLRIIIFIVKVILIPATALLFVAIEWPLPYHRGDVFVAVYAALVADVAASVIEYVVRLFRRRRTEEGSRHKADLKFSAVLSLILCACFVCYGFFNSQIIVKNTHTWQAEGLKEAHTFAVAGDLHTGSAQSMKTLEKFCNKINKASPEFLVIVGDVTDEFTSHDDMIETYQILSKIEVPVYFIYGNHDRQPGNSYVGGRTYTDEELAAAIEGAGIKILSDEFVKVADDLVLLGREDVTMEGIRKPWAELTNPYEGTGALIVADHQPYDEEQLAQEKSALQVSGHTHAGQLWPLQFVYRVLLGLPAYGEFEEAGTRLYVTAGVNDWMIPLRTEEHCEWELITLEPADQQ